MNEVLCTHKPTYMNDQKEELKEILIERDISWLYFNERVLQEATDKRLPLYERIKFLAIFSSNLDEFYRVRVASQRSLGQLRRKTRKEIDIKPKRTLKQIKKIVQEQQEIFGRIYRKEILPELSAHGIHIINENQLNNDQRKFAKAFFNEKIRTILNTIEINPGEKPFLKNKALYLLVTFADNEDRLMLVEIPTDIAPRFIHLPSTDKSEYSIIFLDDIIRLHLKSIFKDGIIENVFAIKISRDAEIYIEDEFEGDLVEKITQGLSERKIGLPTRFLYDSNIPSELLYRIKNLFQLSKYDLVPGARYHNFNDFFGFPNPTGDKQLEAEPMVNLPHSTLEYSKDYISQLQEGDRVLHFPYQKFDYVTRFIRQCAEDVAVTSIKMTLYRAANPSAVAKALLYARECGKAVFVFIELKARFDEESNMYWGEKLEAAGAHVSYSFPGIKVHSKLLLVERMEEDERKFYAYLGTGNFNEKTALVYCDHALLTGDQRLTKEVNQVFDLLEKKIIVPRTKHLLISPFNLRDAFSALIDNEIANAKAGKEASMVLKMNSLEDDKMIAKIHEAVQAGVRVNLIVRGICRYAPDIDRLKDNQYVLIRSILDRYLEHARVYLFHNGGKERMYLASADFMKRNLDRRIEVAFPIYDGRVFNSVKRMLQLQLADNVKARIIDQKMDNRFIRNDRATVRSQQAFYTHLKSKISPTQDAKMEHVRLHSDWTGI